MKHDFKLVEMDNDRWGIKVEDVTVTVNHLKFIENKDGTCTMKFDYAIINPTGKEIDHERFKTVVGDIIVEILEMGDISSEKLEELVEKK